MKWGTKNKHVSTVKKTSQGDSHGHISLNMNKDKKNNKTISSTARRNGTKKRKVINNYSNQ